MRPVFFFPRATIVDCGSSRTSLAVVGKGGKGRLQLEQFAVVPHALEVGSEGNWLIKTAGALATLQSRVKPAGPVTVVLPAHLTLMKMLNTPRVAASKRDKIINFEGQQSIPYPLSEVVWDRLIAGENNHSFNVLLCAAKLDILESLSVALAGAGLLPGKLLPSARALVACFREAQPEAETPTCLVSVGARSTTLVWLDRTAFQARSLLLGGMGVTQQIAETCACDLVRAEEMKLSPSHAEEIAPSVRLFAVRLGQEIVRTLGHFHRPITADQPLRVMLTGGGARLPGLTGLLAGQLKVPVTLLDPTAAIEISRLADDGAGGIRSGEHGPELADVVGAAALQLKGAGAQASLNLLPPRWRQQAGRRRLRPWLAVAAGLAVAAMVPVVAHYHGALGAIRTRTAALERQLVPLRAADARAQERRQKLAEVQRQQEAWRKAAEARTAWLKLLGELEAKFLSSGDVWVERMKVAPSRAENPPVNQTDQSPLRLAFSGMMRTGSADSAETANFERVRSLLAAIAAIPAVATVKSGRFEPAPSGLLRFDFVVVLKESAAL